MFKYILFSILLSLSFELDLNNTEVFSITRNDQNPSFSVSNQKKFGLKFMSNPTTGFDWYLLNSEEAVKSKLLTALNLDQNGGGEYVLDAVSKRMTGRGGNTYFLLESSENGEGEVELKFVYKRPWEAEANMVKNVVVNVGKDE